MMMKQKYNICVQGTREDWFFTGYFLEGAQRRGHLIPEVCGIEDYIFFFDEKFNKVMRISKSKIIWIKEAKEVGE